MMIAAAHAVLAATLAAVSPASGAIPPAPARWVTDEAAFLSPPARQALDRRLEAYEAATGHQVLIWIGHTTGGQPLEDWAARTFAAWGVGRKKLDDGAVVFVLADERKVRIEVGYGLEERIPDVVAARIIRDEMVPRLRAGDRDGAVRAAVDGVLGAAGGERARPPDGAQPSAPARSFGLLHMLVLGLAMIVLLVVVVTHPEMALWLLFTMGGGGGRRSGGWGGGGFGGGGGWGGGGGFSGGGGRSGGGGASGSW
jgi:uncharacterized protein